MTKKSTYEELEKRVRELEADRMLREQCSVDRLIESIQAGVVVHESNGDVIKSNITAQAMLGLTQEQMLGKALVDPAWTFLRADGSPMPIEEYPVSRVIATKKPLHNIVAGIQRSDKAEPIWVLDTAIPEFDENGHISQIITTFMDIGALKKSEEKYRNLFENAMHEVHLWKLVRDEHGSIQTWRLVDINPAALKAWGKTRSEIIGKTTNEIFSYDTTEHFMSIVEKIFLEGTPYTWETYFPPTDQFYHMTSVPFGEYFISTGTDISSRKQVEDALRESEERHRLFYNPSFGGSIIQDKGIILDCSKGVTNITGYSHNELVGIDGLLLIAPDWRDFVMDKIASGFEEPYETEGIRKDGTIFPLRLHAKSIQYHGKEARVVEFRDISDIKKAEQALRESESLLRNIIDSSTDYIFVKDKNLKTILCNKTFAQAVNKKPSDLIGKTDIENGWDVELVKGNPEKGIAGYEKDDLEALSGKIIQNTDTATIYGKTLFFDSVKIPLKNENNGIFGVLGISRDITEKKKAEQALKASEEQFRTLVNTSPFPIVVVTADEKILHWSKSAQDMFGHRPTTAAEWFSLAYPDPQYRQKVIDRSKPYLERAQHSKTAVNTGEYQIVCRDGSIKICEFYAQFISGHLVLTNNDITERKNHEILLEKKNSDLKLAERIASIGMWTLDPEVGVPEWSDEIYRIYERDPDLGPYTFEEYKNIYQGKWWEKFSSAIHGAITNGTPYDIELSLEFSSGEKKWIHAICEPESEIGPKGYKLRGTMQDITEKKEAEEKLRQSQKMESIGTLAGGIAHEFNNMLGIIIGNTELALDDIPEWNPAKNSLKEVRTASLRARDVVRKLLSVARKTPESRKPIQIGSIIRESLDLIRRTIPTTVDIRKNIACSTQMILGNTTEISQVVINLCTNSFHAMSEDSGVLEVGLDTKQLNRDTARHYEDLEPGDYVRLMVKDTGKGIEPAFMDRLFDPYFTTKDVDQGLGMGLAVVHGIVKKHDGAIKIESEVGKGTTVEVLFPLIEEQTVVSTKETDLSPTGAERILLVDDESSLVIMVTQMLERSGYEVVGKTSSSDALELFEENPNQFDLVITDMAMPDMAGDDLAQELIRIRPDIPIILCTGHSHRIDENRAKKLGIKAFAMKPLGKADLINTVRNVLDGAQDRTQ